MTANLKTLGGHIGTDPNYSHATGSGHSKANAKHTNSQPNRTKTMNRTKTIRFALAVMTLSLLGANIMSQVQAADSGQALPPGIVMKAEPKTFVEAVSKINATPAFIDALARQPDKGPTINLNLLRYRPRGDSSRYDLYGGVAGQEIVGVGGDIIFHGEGITDMAKIFEMSNEWDGVAYAMYPRRAAYIRLQEDVDYQMAIPDRVAGTYERMLYLLSDGEAIYKATGSIANFHENNTRVAFKDGNVVVSEFLRFKKPNGRKEYQKFAAEFAPMLKKIGGEVVLSVRAEMPIVSEEYWDHFVSFRFPSMTAMKDLYQSGKYNEISIHRINGLDGSLAVVSEPQKMPPRPKN